MTRPPGAGVFPLPLNNEVLEGIGQLRPPALLDVTALEPPRLKEIDRKIDVRVLYVFSGIKRKSDVRDCLEELESN